MVAAALSAGRAAKAVPHKAWEVVYGRICRPGAITWTHGHGGYLVPEEFARELFEATFIPLDLATSLKQATIAADRLAISMEKDLLSLRGFHNLQHQNPARFSKYIRERL